MLKLIKRALLRSHLCCVVAVISGLSMQPLRAATIVVNGADDTIHAGNCTLRAAVASINSTTLLGACTNTGGAFGAGDLITFAPTVTTITLDDVASNSLNVSANTLTISGGGSVVIQRAAAATNEFRVFNHTGTGTLSLIGLTIRNGVTNAANARGGGVFSTGSLSIQNAVLEANQTRGTGSGGGAAHAVGNIEVINSRIRNNSTLGNSSPGGALLSFAFLSVTNSTIDGNQTTGAGSSGGALASGNGVGASLDLISTRLESNAVVNGTLLTGARGGAAISFGITRILNSIVSNNSAGVGFSTGEGGGVFASAGNVVVEQSTFAGNEAASGGALSLFSSSGISTITNTTFAGNRANSPVTNGGLGGAIYNLSALAMRNSTLHQNSTTGLGGGVFNNNGSITLQSTIIANSISQSAASPAPNVDLQNNSGILNVLGANNLVRVVANVTMPAGTLTGDPLLAALADNGCLAPAGASGTTQCPSTMLPGASSPVINAGNNVAALASDQRGAGFARVVGGQADIGAVESATVGAVTWPVNITLAGVSGGGNVLCTPNPVPNGGNASCAAIANAGYAFMGFSGACISTTCTLTNVTSAQNVTATFALAPTANASQAVPTLPAGFVALLLIALGWLARVAQRNTSHAD